MTAKAVAFVFIVAFLHLSVDAEQDIEEDAYLTIFENLGIHELRHRMHSNLGRSGWSEWEQFSLEDVEAPTILFPTNYSILHTEEIRVKWLAPIHDSSVTEYTLTLAKPFNREVDRLKVLHEIGRKYYEESFYRNDTFSRYRLTIRAVASSGAVSNLSHVDFWVDDSYPASQQTYWQLAGVAAAFAVCVILWIGVRVLCRVWRRKPTQIV